MKSINRLSFLLIALVASVCADAQTTLKLRDLINQQAGGGAAGGASVEMQALLPELSVIRQQYRLERNGEYYGKNNKANYGESYSLAVKVSGGTVFLSDVMEPWRGDADYARDNASGNYKPALYLTFQRPVTTADYKPVDLELKGESAYVQPMNAEKSLYLHTDAVSNFGLSIDKECGGKSGCMIWAYAKNEVRDSAMVVDFRQARLAVEAKADSSLVAMSPAEPERILGGIYVTPKFERGGRVQYLLSGVAVRNKSNGWSLQLLCSDDRITRSGY